LLASTTEESAFASVFAVSAGVEDSLEDALESLCPGALLEVQNDKSVEEIPSPVTGTIKKIIVDEGTVANVGDVLVVSGLLASTTEESAFASVFAVSAGVEDSLEDALES
jgi:hypothetical protein